jgi:hypothetical protein
MAYSSPSSTKVDKEPKSPGREVDKGDDASSSDEEPMRSNTEAYNDTDPDMRIEEEEDYEICPIETEKEKQLPVGRSTLDRVLSRTSAADKDPGPPPDGGFWAWSSGKYLLFRIFIK